MALADEPRLLSQLYELPPLAVKLIVGVPHVSIVVPVLFVILAVGGVVLEVIVIDSVSVQPFAPYTVAVYVPGEVIDAPAELPKLLLHLYNVPPVAVTLIEVIVHVNSVVPVLLVIPALGGVVFEVIVMDSVSVQPDVVAVTVYVLAAVIVAFALLPRLLSHEYVVPPLALTPIEDILHVKTVVPLLFVIVAVGGSFTVIVRVLLAIQLLPSTTFKVYVVFDVGDTFSLDDDPPELQL